MLQEFANHLWQSTLFAGVIGVLCYGLRHDGAHIRYRLWWIASVKFFVPFAPLVAIGAQLAGSSSVAFVPETWTTTAEVVARPFATDADTASPGMLLLALWVAGSAAIFAHRIASAARLRGVLSLAEPDQPIPVDGRRPVRVLRTVERVEPGIVGIFRPILLLPKALDARLKPAQLEAVLTHEIGHIRRQDNLTAAIHMLVETVFWFHPLVWWIGARLVDERERACDEIVVASGHDRQTYAEGLLDVCEHCTATPLLCAAGISGSDLKRRVTQIMRYPGTSSLRLAKKLVLGAASIAVLALPILAGLVAQNAAVAQDQPALRLPPPLFPPDPNSPSDNTEYLPIVKVAPIYPPRAAARGLEGYVIVQYTVTATGDTDNVVVKESSSSLFEVAAIDSAKKYKYMPRVLNGAPVSVDGVLTKIIFDLGDEEIPVQAIPAEDDEADTGGPSGVDTITVTGQ